ncbi:MAG: type I DNA topoisomerase [Proteobacteria bacterium]|nr:type I DNA topoisomerase [Pseudomonadota bacterium]
MKNLLIVESPAKAKTIAKYLGPNYQVVASFGHIRDLPSKDGSVDPKQDFLMHYQVSAKSTKHVQNIVSKAKEVEKIILAPDPDREGESIAWHILEVLKQKKAINSKTLIERVVFNAITKNSVLEAIKNPREINLDLVNAQQARRALDYLVGFNLSPVLWRKLPGSKSAGRVQSVALRIICDREQEIEVFQTIEYWSINLHLSTENKQDFLANLVEYQGKKLEKFSLNNQNQAQEISQNLQNKQYAVSKIEKKQSKRKPYPPFTTSSLQQEAARKLGFSASKTMLIAQKLYEGIEINGNSLGLITYMRTDSIHIINEAINQIREVVQNNYGPNYIPKTANVFKSKVKNAQEAHEAIRPTDFNFEPEKVKNFLENDFFALYNLVWKRTIASQMSEAVFDQVVVEIITQPDFAKARAVGSVLQFDGFYKVYKEDQDDNQNEEEEKQPLPIMQPNQQLDLLNINTKQHFTEPPPRYSEASLVKKMEELGIGRPSTYASIISVLQDRGYVVLEKKRFFPEERGRIVTTFLKEFFSKYVEFDYTANLEDELDNISNGKLNWKNFLQHFWLTFFQNIEQVQAKPFIEVIETLKNKFSEYIFKKDAKTGQILNKCPSCQTGELNLKIGKFGAFIGCSNYPECKHIKPMFSGGDAEANQINTAETKCLGEDPATKLNILLKSGPYGFYLELENSNSESQNSKNNKKTKPKRVSLPKNLQPDSITLETAVSLLSLPREIGIYPQTKEKIIANIGPYGPYLLHNKKFISVKEDNILEIGLNRAIDLIALDQEKPPKKTFNSKKTTKKK